MNNINRKVFRYRLRMFLVVIDAGYTFTDTEQEAMEKAEVSIKKYYLLEP